MNKTSVKTKKLMSVLVLAIAVFSVFNFVDVNLASTLGISSYASKKVIDIISAAGTIWSIVGIVAAVVGTGGIGVGVLVAAKVLAKKYGKKWAAAW